MRYYLVPVFVLFLFLVLGFQVSFSDSSQTKPENIVYLSVDALSAEHMECYGYHRKTSPNICGLENSTLYKNTYATSHWTPVSLASMQRGVYAHRANLVNEDTPISSEYPSIAEIAAEQGYHTVLESNHANVNEEINMDKGYRETALLANSSSMDAFPSEFGKRLDEEKLFYRLHIVGPHDPYDPTWYHFNHTDYRYIDNFNETVSLLPRERRSEAIRGEANISDYQRERVVNHYDENVAAADNYIGEFIEELKESEQYENSLIIITADHGESFNNYGDDTWLHMQPNPPVARVPLVVKYPGSEQNEEDKSLVSIMDPYRIIVNEIGAKTRQDLDAIDPRYEERDYHYTYTKGAGYSVTNKTHIAMNNRNNHLRELWSFFVLEDTEMVRSNSTFIGLKELATEFHREVREGNYSETVSVREDEEIEERLVELGYIEGN